MCFHSHLSHFSLSVSRGRNDLNLCVPKLPGLFETPESNVGDGFTFLDTKLIVGFDFAITRSSPGSLSCGLFDMVLEFKVDLSWLQEKTEKLIKLNRRRRWCHSSQVKLYLVNKSANWFLVSTYLIWICRSKFILHQSSATLWVLDTCLIVGLRPLMIILITASLSSKMYS